MPTETTKLISAERWVDAFLDHHAKPAKIEPPDCEDKECDPIVHVSPPCPFCEKEWHLCECEEPDESNIWDEDELRYGKD